MWNLIFKTLISEKSSKLYNDADKAGKKGLNLKNLYRVIMDFPMAHTYATHGDNGSFNKRYPFLIAAVGLNTAII